MLLLINPLANELSAIALGVGQVPAAYCLPCTCLFWLCREYRDVTSNTGLPTSTTYPTRDESGNLLTTEFGMCVYKNHQVITIQVSSLFSRSEAVSSVQHACLSGLGPGIACNPCLSHHMPLAQTSSWGLSVISTSIMRCRGTCNSFDDRRSNDRIKHVELSAHACALMFAWPYLCRSCLRLRRRASCPEAQTSMQRMIW